MPSKKNAILERHLLETREAINLDSTRLRESELLALSAERVKSVQEESMTLALKNADIALHEVQAESAARNAALKVSADTLQTVQDELRLANLVCKHSEDALQQSKKDVAS